MKYYIDDTSLSLPELQKQIENTDLIPSRQSLTLNINSFFETLAKQKIITVAELRNILT